MESGVIRPRDVIVTYLHHEEGKDFGVRLEHKPTKIAVEVHAETMDLARDRAEHDLKDMVEIAGA